LQRIKNRGARKDPFIAAETVTRYLQAGGTQRAYRVCIKMARESSKDATGRIPTCKELTDTGNRISAAAFSDLKFRATPEGLAVNMRAAVSSFAFVLRSLKLPVAWYDDSKKNHSNKVMLATVVRDSTILGSETVN